VISGNGRYVAFYSYAANLVPDDTNSTTDVFRHDLRTGETIRVSVGPDGAQTSGGQRPGLGSISPAISADGNRIAFGSYANGLTAGPHAISDVYVRDVKAGTTTKASPGIGGAVADGLVVTAHISPDGRYVGYGSAASNLVPGDTNGVSDGFVHDLKNGTTRRVTVGIAGQQGDDRSSDPALDDKADHAAFTSQATNLLPDDANGQQDAFVANL
jgi:Tol biopolymer transport system component